MVRIEKRLGAKQLIMNPVHEGDARQGSVLVLGLGNILMSDDGVGVRAVQEMDARYDFSEFVSLVDGGTMGLDLLPMIEDCSRLLILDAVTADSPPGTMVRADGEEITSFLSSKISPHQLGVKDLFFCARMRGRMPEHAVLLGVAVKNIDTGYGLTGPVADSLAPLMESALKQLRVWGAEIVEKAMKPA